MVDKEKRAARERAAGTGESYTRALRKVREQPDPMRGYDDVLADLGMLDPAEMRLRAAVQEQPVLYALCMALQAWDHVAHRDWRTRPQMVTAARHMVAAGTVRQTELTDDAVEAALATAGHEPALIETDGSGRYRSATTNPEFDVFGVGVSRYLDTMRAFKNDPHRLSPLEAVNAGREHHWHPPANWDAAQACYQRAINSGDPDAVAFGESSMADLAETREQPDEAAERHRRVFELNHPEVSPQSGLWLAQRAYDAGDYVTARALTDLLIGGDARQGVLADTWSLRSVMHWTTGERQQAVTAMMTAVEHAGPITHRLWARLALMHAAMGDLSAAVDAQENVLASAFCDHHGVDVYLQLMHAAGRLPEAPGTLRRLADNALTRTGQLHVGIASAYAMLGDDARAYAAVAAGREHWSASMPEVAARLDLVEALLAIAGGDDERGARLLRSLVADGDEERQKTTHPLLLAAGDNFAAQGKYAAFEGARPLLEFLRGNGSPQSARWAAVQLTRLES